MDEKEKYSIEIGVRSSQSILYNFLSIPESLAEWFAEKVSVEKDEDVSIYVFEWEGQEEKAVMLDKEQDEYIRFQWEYDEDTEYYFEFRIQVDELTKDKALIITDFSEPDELEENKLLWQSQVDKLLLILGN